MYEEDSEKSVEKKLENKLHDEDADVDESEDCDDWDTEAIEVSGAECHFHASVEFGYQQIPFLPSKNL